MYYRESKDLSGMDILEDQYSLIIEEEPFLMTRSKKGKMFVKLQKKSGWKEPKCKGMGIAENGTRNIGVSNGDTIGKIRVLCSMKAFARQRALG